MVTILVQRVDRRGMPVTLVAQCLLRSKGRYVRALIVLLEIEVPQSLWRDISGSSWHCQLAV